jgi:transposase
MQGKKQYQEKLFINFQLSDRVPEDNFYRRLKGVVDFGFLYKRTVKYYGSEGQQSIDPVVFMKLILVGYLENLNSDRRIINTAKMRLDILYFIGYDLDEELPWHSTLSRTRQLYGQEVFTAIFRSVLKQCIEKGMIAGKRQAVDGVYVKANASLDSLIEREILDDAGVYGNELEANKIDDASVTDMKCNKDENSNGLKPKKNPNNSTHYNPSDPDAKMSVKPGKATALNYLGEVSVDTASHMITHIQAFTADKRDSQNLPEVVKNIVENLRENGLIVEEVVADKGFSSGEALKSLEENKIAGYIPNRSQFVFERPGFVYNTEGDYYTCPDNKQLTYRGTYKDPNGFDKYYRAGAKQCSSCQFKGECPVNTKKGGKITDTIDRPYYIRMHHRMQTNKAKRLMKQRQSTVEPVIGTLVNYLGMKRVNTKGLLQANKCLTMAAVAYNLKKLLKHGASNVVANIKKLKQEGKNGLSLCFKHLFYHNCWQESINWFLLQLLPKTAN